MRIALAQSRPDVGCLEANIADHLHFVEVALRHRCDCIVFPELSLLGYEPSFAKSLAISVDDSVLEPLQKLCDETGCRVCFGLPLKGEKLPRIASVTFAPKLEPTIYCKRLLHPDEFPYFTKGSRTESWIMESPRTAIVICFELTDDSLIESACQSGAELLIASVAKHKDGMASARARLSKVASRFKVPVLVVNSLGLQDGMDCSGGSAAWNHEGRLLNELNRPDPGLLLVDFTDNVAQAASATYIQSA